MTASMTTAFGQISHGRLEMAVLGDDQRAQDGGAQGIVRPEGHRAGRLAHRRHVIATGCGGLEAQRLECVGGAMSTIDRSESGLQQFQ